MLATFLLKMTRHYEEIATNNFDDLEAANINYSYALRFCQDAERILNSVPDVTERLQDVKEIINRLNGKRDAQFNCPQHVLLDKLCAIAADRNSKVVEIDEFFAEHKVNVNERSQRIDRTALECAVRYGSYSVVAGLIKKYQAAVNLLPRHDHSGLMRSIRNSTSPAIKDYLFNPMQNFYKNDPQKKLIYFFIAAMAGRLNEVKEQLSKNPGNIIKTPQPDTIYRHLNVLYWAYAGKQKYIYSYLEGYINTYIAENAKKKKWQKIAGLYHAMSNCYQKDGFASPQYHLAWLLKQIELFKEPGSEIVLNMLNRLLAQCYKSRIAGLYAENIERCFEEASKTHWSQTLGQTFDKEFNKYILCLEEANAALKQVSSESLSPEDRDDLALYPYSIVEFLYQIAEKFELPAAQKKPNLHECQQALKYYNEALSQLENVNGNSLEISKEKITEAISRVNEQISNLQKKRQSRKSLFEKKSFKIIVTPGGELTPSPPPSSPPSPPVPELQRAIISNSPYNTSLVLFTAPTLNQTQSSIASIQTPTFGLTKTTITT